jgi:hypothetical protein
MTDSGWAEDFSYDYYRGMLRTLPGRFVSRLFREAPAIPTLSGSVFLRHDIDIHLLPALRMATVEHAERISSTYMVMVRSCLYDVSSADSAHILADIISLGHEVGVHFDCPENLRQDKASLSDIESLILDDCRYLEDILGIGVQSISFHRPIPWLLRGPLMIGGKVNAYANEFMGWYLSDSKGNWRAGEPLALLAESAPHPVLQLLTHPIWWGEEHRPPADRLESFYQLQTRDMEPKNAQEFDRMLTATIPGIRRSGSEARKNYGNTR